VTIPGCGGWWGRGGAVGGEPGVLLKDPGVLLKDPWGPKSSTSADSHRTVPAQMPNGLNQNCHGLGGGSPLTRGVWGRGTWAGACQDGFNYRAPKMQAGSKMKTHNNATTGYLGRSFLLRHDVAFKVVCGAKFSC